MLRLRARLIDLTTRTGVARVFLTASAKLPPNWQRLTVLTWHRIAKVVHPCFDQGVMAASPEEFDLQIAIIKEKFSIIDIAALMRYRDERRPLPPNPVLLTFDDGYRDNLTVALPILQEHHAKAVFFIPTGFMGERKLFSWERVSALIARSQRPQIQISYPEPMHLSLGSEEARRHASRLLSRLCRTRVHIDLPRFLTELGEACEVQWDAAIERAIADELILDWNGVRALVQAGMDVQSHGESHALFPVIPAEEVLRDALASRQALEAQTGTLQVAIAYPAGAGVGPGHPGHAAVEKAGYKLGFSLDSGTCRLGCISDWLNLPRVCAEPGMTENQFRGFLAFPALLA